MYLLCAGHFQINVEYCHVNYKVQIFTTDILWNQLILATNNGNLKFVDIHFTPRRWNSYGEVSLLKQFLPSFFFCWIWRLQWAVHMWALSFPSSMLNRVFIINFYNRIKVLVNSRKTWILSNEEPEIGIGKKVQNVKEQSRRRRSTDVRNSKDSNTRSFNMGPGTSVTAVRYQEQKLATQTLSWAWLESREIPRHGRVSEKRAQVTAH